MMDRTFESFEQAHRAGYVRAWYSTHANRRGGYNNRHFLDAWSGMALAPDALWHPAATAAAMGLPASRPPQAQRPMPRTYSVKIGHCFTEMYLATELDEACAGAEIQDSQPCG